ncbi:peptidase U61 [Bacteroidia bacterium]|nr:peptidase U61 [Bacteroidia bacterium]
MNALKQGDSVALVAPAKQVSNEIIQNAIETLTQWGLNVFHISNNSDYLDRSLISNISKTSDISTPAFDLQRTAEFQAAIDNPEIKAIFCLRGGYGSIRIIDELDFSKFIEHPKWIIGYSDITVIQQHIFTKYGIPSIHAEMPLHYPPFHHISPSFSSTQTSSSIQLLKDLLFNFNKTSVFFDVNNDLQGEHSRDEKKVVRTGKCTGQIVGGNLAVFCNLLGSESMPDTSGKILFLEDVGEYLYAIDRMMFSLKRAGKLHNLAGLLVGNFTEIKDTEPPFGQSVEKIIFDKVKEFDYPVVFNFPAGHNQQINTPFFFGIDYVMEVSRLSFSLFPNVCHPQIQ